MSSLLQNLTGARSAGLTSAAISGVNTNALSYLELQALLGRTQTGLRGLGFGPKSRIALVVNDGPLAASAFIAVAASAVCAPLNPAYGAKELGFYGDDLGIELFLCDSGNIDRVRPVAEQLGARCLELVAATESAADFRVAEFGNPANVHFELPDSSAIALLLHTSGTTSRPKVVPLSWQNLSASAANVAATLALAENDVCLNVMPLFHIHGLVACVLASLHAGGSVFCVRSFDGAAFLERWLTDSAATWYSAVPTIHQALIRAAADTSLPPNNLRFARSSSASLPPSVLGELAELLDVPVVEAYGMTEAAHQMACNPLRVDGIKPGSVGLPAGPELAIMAETTAELLPQGDIGEVVIRGLNVTPGYLANPEANAVAFTDGWFRTGDQGYLDQDGYLFLTGRLKEIINRGGEKVSPREVDEAALALPGVVQAVAFARPHKSLGEDVAMAVILEPGSKLTPSAIRTALFESLAAFKVPSDVIVVDAIPKGPTGKLQRIGLAEKLQQEPCVLFEAPRSELERLILNSLLDVLPDTTNSRIGIHDNFFNLGGDSLSGVRAVAALSEVLGLDLIGAELFRNPATEQLAERIAHRLHNDGLDAATLKALCSHEPDAFERFLSSGD